MAYGTLKCDNITFTNGGIDQTVTVSGIVQSISGNITATGTIQAATIIGTSTVSGATVTGTAGVFTTVTGGSAGFTTVTGTTVTGTTANFATLSGTTITGSVGNFGSGSAAAPSVSVGTTDNGIYSPGADQVAISTNGVGRLLVDASGNVGVGATPAVRFHVSALDGTIYQQATRGTGTTWRLQTSGANGQSYELYDITNSQRAYLYAGGTGGSWQFSTEGAERLRITSDGKVGLGTSSPNNLLEVAGGTIAGSRVSGRTYTLSNVSSANPTTVNGSGFNSIPVQIGDIVDFPFGQTRTVTAVVSDTQLTVNTAWSVSFAGSNVTGYGSIGLLTNSANRLHITAGGNVGVGSTAPGAPLTIGSIGYSTTDRASALRLLDVGGTNGNNYGFGMDNTVGGFYRTAGTGGFHAWLTANTERARIDSSGRLLVGTSTATESAKIQVSDSGGACLAVIRNAGNAGGPFSVFYKSRGTEASPSAVISADSLGTISWAGYDGTQYVAGARIAAEVDGTPGANDMPGRLVFSTTADGSSSPTERARIDSSGRLLVGTSSASGGYVNDSTLLHIQSGGASAGISIYRPTTFAATAAPYIFMSRSRGTPATAVVSGDRLGEIVFAGADGTDVESTAAKIYAEVDGTPGANDMPGRLVFSTTATGASSPTQALLISNARHAYFGTGTPGQTGLTIYAPGTTSRLYFNRSSTAATSTALEFADGGSTKGSITYTNTATAYNTSSDYRLKENVTAVTDGITRLQQLRPSRFNFIADPDKTVDGFLAHEVQDIVPEAITGEKDAVDADGNPEYQGIDQSKLVPLLTAALQEAVAKIESLEARLTAAGI